MDILPQLLDDLRAEGDDLDALVADLDPDQWAAVTPAEPWTIADTIGHLLWTDRIAVVAATDEAAFQQEVATQFASLEPGVDPVTTLAQRVAAELGSTDALLAEWRDQRAALIDALKAVPAGTKIPWFGPPMSPASKATARLMETWAHGHDVAHTLGVSRQPTARLKHVAHLAVRTRGFAYAMHERAMPEADVRVELIAPDGERWVFGPEDAAQSIVGSALDWCLLAVQRIHAEDTDLVATGEAAADWLTVVQAFAGPPGEKRAPGEGHR